MSILVLFPNQLFHPSLLPSNLSAIFLLEDPLFFQDPQRLTRMNFIKRVFHRTTMQVYYKFLQKRGMNVKYIEYETIKRDGYGCIDGKEEKWYWINPVDHLLEKRFRVFLKRNQIENIYLETPLFLTSEEECKQYAKSVSPRKKLYQTPFYQYQRRRFQLWVDENGKPFGGKWSYDEENRKPFPSTISFPQITSYHTPTLRKEIEQAKQYVEKMFPNSIRMEGQEFIFPVDHLGAKKWYQQFLKERFAQFGLYEDAMYYPAPQPFLFHSGISCLLNCGLLTPAYVIQELQSFVQTHPTIPFSSVEGFLRQIIGWREHCRLTYLVLYKELKKTNVYRSIYRLKEEWYTGETGIEPIDDSIRMGFRYGYLHHIHRLMVMGSAMMMLEVHPDQAMKWFYEMSCDSYEWNMINNVKCMAMGNLLYTTKPYMATSNYLKHMSNYPRDGKWDLLWDGMYWRFLKRHQLILKKNGRFGMIQVKYLKKKTIKQMKEYEECVKSFQKKFLY